MTNARASREPVAPPRIRVFATGSDPASDDAQTFRARVDLTTVFTCQRARASHKRITPRLARRTTQPQPRTYRRRTEKSALIGPVPADFRAAAW
jgi:hypothetical protein